MIKIHSFRKKEDFFVDFFQPDKPLMVTEYWSGWFDHWGESHHVLSVEKVVSRVTTILQMGASINFYMFHGKIIHTGVPG